MSASSTPVQSRRIVGRGHWAKRLGLAVLAPLIVLALLEVGLRVAGFGYPTAFLLPASQGEQTVWIPNPRFTWRFFGPERARGPAHFELARSKDEHTIRIFVLGESAAHGDPDADFGLPRMLQAVLELRYPEARFEVANAAITGINSHAIVSIAKDCARADGDIWVTYIGNNEVVGPFGAGTVFGPQAPPLPWIRARLAVLSTRLGQETDRVLRRFRPLPRDKQVWGGLLMFAENKVRSQDPRMETVYHHFERNLNAILDRAQDCGVGVVVSTVAVNLQDGGPFASVHRDGLDDQTQARWRSEVQHGAEAMVSQSPSDAMALFQKAAGIDDSPAELHYFTGHALLEQGDVAGAEQALATARDLDALRFRCDNRLNEITRRIAVGRAGDRMSLVDAEQVFAMYSRSSVPGFDLFYDHVHPTFEGNHLLATLIARQIDVMLPEDVRAGAAPEWPSVEACAQRLAWTPVRETRTLSTMLGRYGKAPFTFQPDHERQMQRLRAQVLEVSRVANALDPMHAADACRRALAVAPHDATIQRMLAEILRAAPDPDGAAVAAQRVVDAMPNNRDAWILLGAILIDGGEIDPAIAALRRAKPIEPDDGLADYFLGLALAKSNRPEEAEQAYLRAIKLNPRLGPVYLDLASLLDESGRASEADVQIRHALSNRVLTSEYLTSLAAACVQREWFPEALTSLVSAIELSPVNPRLRVQAGECLDAMGMPEKARAYYQQAVDLAPDEGRYEHLLGLSYARANDLPGALRHFAEAARLLPEVAGIRLNLAQAQALFGRPEAAMRTLQEVLGMEPDHEEAQLRLAELQSASDE